MVPLVGENRSLGASAGSSRCGACERPGIRALVEAAKCEPTRLDEGDLAFRLAPRINAAGRLYRADAGVELFLTEDPGRAAEIANELSRANGERRATEREVDGAAESARRALPDELREAPALVVAGEGWHPGRDRDRRLAAGRAPPPAGDRDLARRRRGRARLGPQHPRLRPARRPRGLRGAPDLVRRAPRGGGTGAEGGEPRRLPRGLRRPRGGGARPGGPDEDRADRRDGRRRRPRPRSRRGARPAGAVRDGQPGRAAAGPGRPRARRAADGPGGEARALQPAQRRAPGARRRLRPLAARGRRRRHGRRRGAARGQPLERRGRAAGRAARALSARGRRRRGGRGVRLVGPLRGRARRRSRPPGLRRGASARASGRSAGCRARRRRRSPSSPPAAPRCSAWSPTCRGGRR